MSKIKQVKVFKTSDNKIFETELDAKRHQKEIIIKEKLERIVDDFYYYNIERDDLIDSLFNRLYLLEDIFK
jgi:hypothetical protein